jgi:hypothetical protein
MEPIVQGMRETAVELERMADANIQAKKGHRFVDIANREKAVNLLERFQQGYPSNQEFKNYDIGPRFTWRMLKSFAVKLFNAL